MWCNHNTSLWVFTFCLLHCIQTTENTPAHVKMNFPHLSRGYRDVTVMGSCQRAEHLGQVLAPPHPHHFTTNSVPCINSQHSQSTKLPHHNQLQKTWWNSWFPTTFDREIKTMEGKEFHTSLVDNAKPSCANTPTSIPFTHTQGKKFKECWTGSMQAQGNMAPAM